MMTSAVEALTEAIHRSPTRLVMAVSGGGSGAIAALLRVPGASRTLLEAVVPYSAAGLKDWLGAEPEQACSAATARAMAMVAFFRARRLAPCDEAPAGIGVTASLASDRPKRGAHRLHLAVQTLQRTVAWSVELDKGARTRAEEEDLTTAQALNVVAEACGLGARVAPPLRPGEQLLRDECVAPPAWQDLLLGRSRAVRHPAASSAKPQAVFPGAFNPLHAGHRRIAEIAAARLGGPVEAELSIANVDKPPLDYIEIRRRLAQFPAGQGVWLTRAPTFAEKAALFPGATFVVGADTLLRIADPRYYGGDARARAAALESIIQRGCRLLVFARLIAGRLVRAADLDLPEELQAVIDEASPEEFRDDVSSTELRRQSADGESPAAE